MADEVYIPTESEPVGMVLGTEDSTPLAFWVGVAPGAYLTAAATRARASRTGVSATASGFPHWPFCRAPASTSAVPTVGSSAGQDGMLVRSPNASAAATIPAAPA